MPSYSYTRAREDFIVYAVALGLTITRARTILAKANTIQRIAADDCSNESAYAAMAAKRARCPVCAEDGPQDRTYDLTRKRLCPEHRAMAAIAAAIAGVPAIHAAEYSGDPRGCCVKLQAPRGKGDSWGDDSLLCVPTRGY